MGFAMSHRAGLGERVQPSSQLFIQTRCGRSPLPEGGGDGRSAREVGAMSESRKFLDAVRVEDAEFDRH